MIRALGLRRRRLGSDRLEHRAVLTRGGRRCDGLGSIPQRDAQLKGQVAEGVHMTGFVARSVRATVVGIVALCASASAAQAAPTGLSAYSVRADNGRALRLLAQEGFDLSEGARGGRIEIVATSEQARGLRKFGLEPTLEASGSARAARIRPDGSYEVYRPYWDHTY